MSNITSKNNWSGNAAPTTDKTIAAGIAANGNGAPVVPTPVPSGSGTTLPVPSDRRGRETKALELRDQLGVLARRSAVTVVALGEILSLLKAEVGHGQWETYTQGTLGIPPRTARDYMAFSRKVSERGGIGELLKSPSDADLGKVGVKDLKALLLASGESGGKRPPTPAKPKAAPVRLVDGSNQDLMEFGWKEGLIPKARLETWIEDIVPDDDEEGNGRLARRQRVVAALAATVNRMVGRAAAEEARELIGTCVSDLLELIHPQTPAYLVIVP